MRLVLAMPNKHVICGYGHHSTRLDEEGARRRTAKGEKQVSGSHYENVLSCRHGVAPAPT